MCDIHTCHEMPPCLSYHLVSQHEWKMDDSDRIVLAGQLLGWDHLPVLAEGILNFGVRVMADKSDKVFHSIFYM